MGDHLEVGKVVVVVAVRLIAVATHGEESVHGAGGADLQRDLVGTAEEVPQSTVVVVGEAAGHVSVEELRARVEGDLLRSVRIMALTDAETLAAGEGSVIVNGMVVAPLSTAEATVVETVLAAKVHMSSIYFVAAAVDVVQVDGHEEAAHFICTSGGLAGGEVISAWGTVQTTADVATGGRGLSGGCC